MKWSTKLTKKQQTNKNKIKATRTSKMRALFIINTLSANPTKWSITLKKFKVNVNDVVLMFFLLALDAVCNSYELTKSETIKLGKSVF